MTGDQTVRLIYLLLLGGVVGGAFLVANRQHMGRMLQQAMIWAFLFVGVILVYGIWGDVSQTVLPRQAVVSGEQGTVAEVPRSFDGHYHMVLGVEGEPVRFVVDTGATHLVLRRDDAARIGLDLDGLRYTGRAQTANGQVRTASVTLDRVSLGDLVDRDVPAVVNEGEMTQSLLGMSYLQRFGRIEIEDDTLRLIR